MSYVYFRIHAVPAEILRGCASLATLTLHNNSLTAEQLRETPGYSEMDARRRAKYDKQLESRVLLGRGGLDEGVDVEEFEHW